MRKTVKNLIALSCLGALLAFQAQADQLEGSLPLNGINLGQNGLNLGVSTEITATGTWVLGPGDGDYNAIPLLTDFGAFTLDLTQIAVGGGFSLNNATYGSFAPTTGQITQQQADFLDVVLVGTFTPGPGLPGFDPTQATLRISLNQSGTALSQAITLSSTAAVPDGGLTVSLMGMGLASLGLLSRRAKK